MKTTIKFVKSRITQCAVMLGLLGVAAVTLGWFEPPRFKLEGSWIGTVAGTR